MTLERSSRHIQGRAGRATLNRLHGPPKESKIWRREGLKGLRPYIRAVYAVVPLPMMAIRG